MWFFMDAYRFSGFMKAGESSLIVKMLSAYNNAFFLAGISFFGNPFPKWGWFNQSLKWATSILVTNVILVMVFALLWYNPNAHIYINYFDLVYSALTYFLLFLALATQIKKNSTSSQPVLKFGLVLLGVLTLIQVFFSPVFKIGSFDVISVFALVCQFSLILVVLVLGYQKLLLAQSKVDEAKMKVAIEEGERKIKMLELQLEDAVANKQFSQVTSSLTEREKEVLKWMELSYSEIGEKLFITRDTVISHKKNIESKLGISGKGNLVEFMKSQRLQGE